MTPRLDHIGLDVRDYEASKSFYEQALAPLGITFMMEPVAQVGGFGGDFPFFWVAKRGRGAVGPARFPRAPRPPAPPSAEPAPAGGGARAVRPRRSSGRSRTRQGGGRAAGGVKQAAYSRAPEGHPRGGSCLASPARVHLG